MQNPIFSGTQTLRAMTHDDITMLWGLNANRQVYYLACPTAQLALPRSWGTPVLILDTVEHLTAYVNRDDGGNTIFASRDGQLYHIIQATETSSKMWRAQTLKPAATRKKQPSLHFTSYTTIIHVTGPNKLPAPGVTLTIPGHTRTPVYMNGVYYVVGRTPVEVKTDSTGVITVVEATEDLNATILTVSIDGGANSEVINTMHTAFNKTVAARSRGTHEH